MCFYTGGVAAAPAAAGAHEDHISTAATVKPYPLTKGFQCQAGVFDKVLLDAPCSAVGALQTLVCVSQLTVVSPVLLCPL